MAAYKCPKCLNGFDKWKEEVIREKFKMDFPHTTVRSRIHRACPGCNWALPFYADAAMFTESNVDAAVAEARREVTVTVAAPGGAGIAPLPGSTVIRITPVDPPMTQDPKVIVREAVQQEMAPKKS